MSKRKITIEVDNELFNDIGKVIKSVSKLKWLPLFLGGITKPSFITDFKIENVKNTKKNKIEKNKN